jgi:hypothetical protein
MASVCLAAVLRLAGRPAATGCSTPGRCGFRRRAQLRLASLKRDEESLSKDLERLEAGRARHQRELKRQKEEQVHLVCCAVLLATAASPLAAPDVLCCGGRP